MKTVGLSLTNIPFSVLPTSPLGGIVVSSFSFYGYFGDGLVLFGGLQVWVRLFLLTGGLWNLRLTCGRVLRKHYPMTIKISCFPGSTIILVLL